MSARIDADRNRPPLGDRTPGEGIVRYTAGVRTTHWIVALAFILTALSGLSLFDPVLFWLSALFGGGPSTRIVHPFLGLLMVGAFVVLAALVQTDNKMTAADWQWLRQWRDVISNREERLPEVGRFNAGQKLIFFLAVLTLAGLLVTGILIWRQYFTFHAVRLIRVGSLLHSFCAFVLIVTIIVHVYAAIWVRGSVRAMTRGTVSPGWAWKHHRGWFREVTNAARSGSRAD